MSDQSNADAGRALEGRTNPGADTGVAPPAPGSVFEVVDHTNDETYFPLGIYLSLDEAKQAVLVDDPNDIGCHDHEGWEDCVVVEIRERVLGWSGHGKCVHRVTWTYSYDADDEGLWSRRDTPNGPAQERRTEKSP